MTKLYIIKCKFGVFYFKDKACTIFHREDGAAYEHVSGTKAWYLNGKLHRVDGPAYEYQNSYKEWYWDGKQCSEKEYEVLTKRKNLINFL